MVMGINMDAAVIIEQKNKVDEILKRKMLKNELWYILSLGWWGKWETFVDSVEKDGTAEHLAEEYPGKVDNRDLLTVDGKLKPDLLMENDITVIPSDVWDMFVEFYGCYHIDTTVFQRFTIQAPKAVEVEIYPPHYSFYLKSTDRKETFLFEGTYSKVQTIKELKEIVSKHLKLASNTTVCLFVRNERSDLEELNDDSASIEEASLEREKAIYVNLETRNGVHSEAFSGSLHPKSNNPVVLPSGPQSLSLHTLNTTLIPGVCGLNNLGNTCFMNSALQCMSNVPALTKYFLSGRWKTELNLRNPLGSQGRIATAYADLIHQLWSGSRPYAVPREFKIEIARIARQFSGYAQHDTHELLVFLLDGLHEDLNRIQKKPYIEVKDSDGRPDNEVANESWRYYKSRNDSIIVDLFHGQLKSTVICPTCQRKSITFDPFASLILPIPELCRYTVSVYVWPWKSNTNPSELQLVDVIVPAIPCAQNIMEALEQCKPPQKGCQYYIPNKPVDRSRYAPPLFAYELAQGYFIPVFWVDDNTYHTVNLSFFISIPFVDFTSGASLSISESILIKYVVRRLRAIGFDTDKSTEDSVSQSLYATRLNDRKSGDQLPESEAGSSENTTRAHFSSCLQNHASPDDLECEQIESSNNYSKLQRPEDSLSTLLQGRLCLKDSRGHDWLSNTDGGLISLPCSGMYSLLIDCQGIELQRRLSEIRNQVQQRPINRVNQALKLSDCFDKFTDAEQLGARDLWYCNRCKAEKPATKKFDLWKLPDVLVVQLKRFRSHLRFHDKIDTLLDFPLIGLDLTARVLEKKQGEKFIYDLVAVNNHMGYLGGGHYTAFALNASTNHWYYFDDSSTREVDPSKVVTNAAYVLVYIRRRSDRIISMNQNNEFDEESASDSDEYSYSNGQGRANFVSYRSSSSNYGGLHDQDLMDIE